jgi:hypothetical protein
MERYQAVTGFRAQGYRFSTRSSVFWRANSTRMLT